MIIDFYDTSALLALDEPLGPGINYISHFVLAELEQIKTSFNKDKEIKERARKIARSLISRTEDFRCDIFPAKEIEKQKKRLGFLPDNMDGNILAEASLISKKERVIFWTADVNMLLFAKELNFYAINFIDENKEEKKPWDGWRDFHPTEEQMNMLYSDPKFNVLGAKTNEYCKIWEGEEIKDVLRWDGQEYKKLKYSNFKDPLGQNISARNLEQKMALDLLQNKDITVNMILGKFGTGKTLLALMNSLNQVQKGEYEKIVYVRNNIPVKNTEQIGALPGSEIEKLYPYLQQIADHTSPIMLDDMINQNIIEPIHLGFLRSRDIKNAIIFCDEVENMTYQHMQLLLGRVAKGSKLILVGDVRQVDKDIFRSNSGIVRASTRLAGNPLFGCVKLVKTERSETASLADLLD